MEPRRSKILRDWSNQQVHEEPPVESQKIASPPRWPGPLASPITFAPLRGGHRLRENDAAPSLGIRVVVVVVVVLMVVVIGDVVVRVVA